MNWISVKDRFPEIGIRKLLITQEGHTEIGYYHKGYDKFLRNIPDDQWEESPSPIDKVTHWAEITPPKEQDDLPNKDYRNVISR